MLFIKVNPNGTIEELTVEGEAYPVLRHAVGGLIEPIQWADDIESYHNEEFLYAEGEEFDQVNLVAALMGGPSKVYGPMIFTGGIDDEGETVGLSEENAQNLRELSIGVIEAYETLHAIYQSPRGEVVPAFSITSW